MDSTRGRLLVALPNMGDANFDQTVIYVLDHDAEGAVGVVVNRPSEVPVGMHLPTFSAHVVQPDVFFVGGPVGGDVVMGLGVIDATIQTVDLDAVLEGSTPPSLLRLFAGYAGWAGGQLDAELALDAWLVVDGGEADVFSAHPGDLWRSVLRRQGGAVGRLAMYPDSPAVN